MKYQALRPQFFSMVGGWRVLGVGGWWWGGSWGGWGWWWGFGVGGWVGGVVSPHDSPIMGASDAPHVIF